MRGRWLGTMLVPMLLLAGCGKGQVKNERKEKLERDRAEYATQSGWIYDELDTGFAAAAAERKPLLVSLRCIP